MDAHLRYFKQGYELLHQMEPYINQGFIQWDRFHTQSYVAGGMMQFHVGGLAHIKDKAETTLNFYNKKKRKNFVLDKVVKVNRVSDGACFCMTFWVMRDENDERNLFRGVYCRGNVLQCEIKDGDCEITIPAGHVDGVLGPSEIGTENLFYECFRNAPDVCTEDEDDE